MDNLWKPDKYDRSCLNRGIRKIRIHNLKADNLIEDGFCPYCETQVYRFTTEHKFLTLNGSTHKCKDMPKIRI